MSCVCVRVRVCACCVYVCVHVWGRGVCAHPLQIASFSSETGRGSSAGYENGERGAELGTRVTGWWADRMPRWFASGVATLPILVTWMSVTWGTEQAERGATAWLPKIHYVKIREN